MTLEAIQQTLKFRRAVNSNGFSSSASHLMCIEGVFGGSDGKESAYNTGDPSLIPRSGSSPGEGIGYSLQYSGASLVAQIVKNLPTLWETWV